MDELKKLAKELARCRAKGVMGGAGFPRSIRVKACSAARKYGVSAVSSSIIIRQSVLRRWMADPANNRKIINKNSISFKELPAMVATSPCTVVNPAVTTTIRVTSATGVVVEIDGINIAQIERLIGPIVGLQK